MLSKVQRPMSKARAPASSLQALDQLNSPMVTREEGNGAFVFRKTLDVGLWTWD